MKKASRVDQHVTEGGKGGFGKALRERFRGQKRLVSTMKASRNGEEKKLGRRHGQKHKNPKKPKKKTKQKPPHENCDSLLKPRGGATMESIENNKMRGRRWHSSSEKSSTIGEGEGCIPFQKRNSPFTSRSSKKKQGRKNLRSKARRKGCDWCNAHPTVFSPTAGECGKCIHNGLLFPISVASKKGWNPISGRGGNKRSCEKKGSGTLRWKGGQVKTRIRGDSEDS